MKMEEESSGISKNEGFKLGIEEQWIWAGASIAQLGWGIKSYRKGFSGDSKFMPLKAFSVASLFVGAAATASFGVLRACGIHKVEDLIKAGANIRSGLGVPPRKKGGS
ncbi:uncharacterized protein LOC130820677 [Amaranthus tricolor]|uniref:uncharacterized protein LOC130820677 n=1 Tax=Amaranthus tricolor TaxID=29722 RepID=UPI00258A90BC|nr:uncharacterized protein LOC130820677 [Amaranthus tricolor]